MIMNNKKALSEVVSYVLLIVIAMTLSIVVFTFLSNLVPEEKKSCNESLSLIIRDFECRSGGEVLIEFQNKGNFKIDGIYIKSGNSSVNNTVNLLNATYNATYGANSITKQRKGFLYFGRTGDRPLALAPNRNYAQTFNYGEYGDLTNIQVQPFMNEDDGSLIICEDKTITQEIKCP